MATTREVTYAAGGFNPAKPDGAVLSVRAVEVDAAQVNSDAIQKAAAAALATNRAIVSGADAYLAITSPSAAQVAAQVRGLTQAVRALAQQDNGLIRLVLGLLDGTD